MTNTNLKTKRNEIRNGTNLDIHRNDPNYLVRLEVAKFARDEDLIFLHKDRSEQVRIEVAKHAFPELTSVMIHDQSPKVRAKCYNSLSCDLQSSLVNEDEDSQVQLISDNLSLLWWPSLLIKGDSLVNRFVDSIVKNDNRRKQLILDLIN